MRNVVVLAVVFEAVFMLLGWLLIGPPQSMSSIPSFKLTVTVGMPSLSQLLEPAHQMTSVNINNLGGVGLMLPLLTTVLFSFGNALYISLFGRSLRNLEGTVRQDALRKTLPLLGWSVFQMLLGLIMMLILVTLGTFGGILSIVLLLWFRYAFFFFEYTLVLRRVTFAEAWGLCREIRKKAEGFGRIFLYIVLLNGVLAFVVNILFSWPVLVVMLVVNALAATYLQRRAMEAFFAAEAA